MNKIKCAKIIQCLKKSYKDMGKHKIILLSERSQYEKATYHMIPTTSHSGKGKTMATIKKISQWLPGTVVGKGKK